ncbi:neuropeptide FF receptor 2-like, partial [Paramuricea clavata]
MGMTYDVYRYSDFIVLVFGTIGNILVAISVLRQKTVLENRHYFLVLQLAICDLGVLIIYLSDRIASYWYESLFTYSVMSCALTSIYYVFQVAGICMMLVISLLRYRATVHPLKPAISRRKLKVVCGLVYLFGLFAG